MREVNLTTFDGKQVTTVFVPPFVHMPEVLIWGTRVFIRQGDVRSADTYAEGMACVCWTAEELKNLGVTRN